MLLGFSEHNDVPRDSQFKNQIAGSVFVSSLGYVPHWGGALIGFNFGAIILIPLDAKSSMFVSFR